MKKIYAVSLLLIAVNAHAMENTQKKSNLLESLVAIYHIDKIQKLACSLPSELYEYKQIMIQQAYHLTQDLSKDQLTGVLSAAKSLLCAPVVNGTQKKPTGHQKIKID